MYPKYAWNRSVGINFVNFYLYLPIIINRMNIMQCDSMIYIRIQCRISQLNSKSVKLTNGIGLDSILYRMLDVNSIVN